MISIDETFPVDGDFMLFLLISGVGCWIWVFVEGTLFVHVNLFHLLFNAGLLLINQTPPAQPTRAAARCMHHILSSYLFVYLITSFYLLTKPRRPTLPAQLLEMHAPYFIFYHFIIHYDFFFH